MGIRSAMIHFLLIAALMTYASSVTAADERPKGQNCALNSPPATAGEEINHGVTLKIFPRARDMARTYTGCQTLWMPEGNKWMVVSMVVIASGDPERLWSPNATDPKRAACRYKYGKVVSGDPHQCPSPEFLIMKSLAAGCVERIVRSGGTAFPPGCEYE